MMPAGPGGVYVEFKLGSMFDTVNDQQKLRRKIIKALKDNFTKLTIDANSVVVYRRGLSYKFKVLAPVKDLGNNEFPGYWLKADVVLEFTKQFDEDMLELNVPDGFLALWNRIGTPPDGHFDHLSPDGKDKFHNFNMLEWLQLAVANCLASAWDGQVDSP